MTDLWAPGEAGQNWETQLERLHKTYLDLEQACVFRTPAEVRVVGRGKYVRTGKGPPDFTGVAGPWAVLAEAKTSVVGRFKLEMLKEHQAERMTQWEAQDSRDLAMVLYWDRLHDVQWILPWEDLRDRWYRWHNYSKGKRKAGESSLSVEQLDQLGLRFDPSGWLNPLHRWATPRLR